MFSVTCNEESNHSFRLIPKISKICLFCRMSFHNCPPSQKIEIPPFQHVPPLPLLIELTCLIVGIFDSFYTNFNKNFV